MPAPVAHRGLTPAEVEASRQRHGPNVLTPPPRKSWWREYLSKFNDPVIRILMIAAGLAIGVGAVDGRMAEGAGILVAIFLATFLAYWNEHRAERALDILNRSDDGVPVKAIRDGGYAQVPKHEVVVGDLVFVEVGEEVPADGVLLDAVGLLVAEAKLTGEARAVHKRAEGPDRGTTYSPGRLLRGTIVADGYGTFEVTAVGDATEIGKTFRESTIAAGGKSPLQKHLARLSKVIGVVGFGVALLALAALVGRGAVVGTLVLTAGQWLVAGGLAAGVAVALVRVWWPVVGDAIDLCRGGEDDDDDDDDDEPTLWQAARPWLLTAAGGAGLFAAVVGAGVAAGAVPASPGDWLPAAAGREFLRDFMIAVTIVVVAVPEGLAMSVTLSLAYSMRKMTAQNTLVRRMDATHAVGAATVICSDKTGTLTANEMRVAAGVFGGAEAAGLPADPGLRRLVAEAVAANTTAHLGRHADGPHPIGNPTEGALLLWLDAGGEDYVVARKGFALQTQWPFNTERKYMATRGTVAAGGAVVYVKGAPELLLAAADRQHAAGGPGPFPAADRAAVAAALAGFQARGMRTLGLAYRPDPDDTADPLAGGLVWLGLVALADPVRPEVPEAVRACRRAGIRVKVVTGDTAATAAEVARQIGVLPADPPAGAVLTGAEFAALDDPAATAAGDRLAVLARARPADKLRLVTLLKERGEVVAVTGDGVNDGPALNHADVGLAMGRSGTAVAKEASDIVLLDDSFGSIVTAVRWGRALYENIQRFVLYQLTINVAALGLAVLGPFVGYELPLTVLQMLWVNLIMDTFAALALATEPPHPGLLARPPRDPAAFLVTRPMAVNIFATAGIFLAILVGLIVYQGASGQHAAADVPTRAGTILFTVFVLLQFWNLFNAKCLGRSGSVFPALANNPSFLAVAAVILVGQVLLVQFGGDVFRTVPLSAGDWAVLLGLTSLVLWVGEGVRLFARPAVPTEERP